MPAAPDDFAWVDALREERRASGSTPISAVLHTLNEEAAVAKAVHALSWCDEVLVVDMHSDDRTAEIAQAGGARVVQHERTGYVEPARNFGIQSAGNRWVLVCDADERIPQALARDLTRIADEDSADVVSIPKTSRIAGRWLRATGWGGERHYRFFKQDHVVWSPDIHSVPQVRGRVVDLPRREDNEVRHETARDVQQFVEKLLRYARFEADVLQRSDVAPSWDAAMADARREIESRWSVDEDGTLSAVLAAGLFFYRLLAHFEYWERLGFPDVQPPRTVESALREFGRLDRDAVVRALAESRQAERDMRTLSDRQRAQLGALQHELDTLRVEYHRLQTDYHRTIHSRSWLALERTRRARRTLRSLAVTARRTAAGAVHAPEPAPQVPAPTDDQGRTVLATLAFDEVDQPLVSIVIPVYNQLAYTAQCLASIRAAATGLPYEVIVVDDCSSDATPQLLPRVAGVRVHRNQRNLGFCETVNNGAALARGEYLVLLNNDTEVRDHWLDTLVDAVRSAPDVGAVGSKLIYPDGVLQEAGGIVWRDGSAWNVGRNDNPERPTYEFRREVDYCSAAALLVRRDLWDELGGFDLRFAPGYYEDTDLCFALRARGHRVLYEPHSVVVHHEGRTYGTDTGGAAVGQHTKQSQYRNQATFAEKWAAELSAHLPNGAGGGLYGGRRDRRPRVLVLDSWVPAHDQDSGSLRMTWMLRLLAGMGCHVTLYPHDRNGREPYTAEFRRHGIEVWPGPWTFADLAEPRPNFYDVVVVSRAGVAEDLMDEVRRAFPTAALVYDTVDLHFVREERRLETLGIGEAAAIARTKAVEVSAIRAADVSAAVTQTEADMIVQAVPTASVVVLPNVHEVAGEPPPDFDVRHDLLFIGGFDHDPNVDAVHHLVREILPRVREHAPARLWVVGSKPPPEISAYHGDEVVVTGYLRDVAEYFRMARVFVAPLRYGAGMKGKIGHALSMGLPVVTSSIGAEGMGLVDGHHALIRDEPAAFADAVVQAYSDRALWTRLSREGLALVRECWTPEVMGRRLRALLQQLAPQRTVR